MRWAPDALDDLERLYDFIATHSADAAQNAIETILSAATTLCDFPEAGRPRASVAQFRELPVRFGVKGYVVRYRIHGDEVIIIRVWHTREDR
ncbi:MAG: protein of the plasmid stabilization system [Robiginitomaculum sp.]|nr:MAG: protein of the plasmid stabilization system [Robiginitomaculum sp.]